MQATAARNPAGIPGVFGAPVAAADSAPLLERLVGLSGRNPAWEGLFVLKAPRELGGLGFGPNDTRGR